MRLCMKQVLYMFSGLFLIELALVPSQYRALCAWFTSKTLYDGSEFFRNERSPLSTFRLVQSARLHRFQLQINIQLEGRFLNPNKTSTTTLPQLDEWERWDFAHVIQNVHVSMLKEVGNGAYYKRVPTRDAFRLKKSLENEAILVYRVETFGKISCTNEKNHDVAIESLVAPMTNTPGAVTQLFQKTLEISNTEFPHCEQTRTSVIHIPRAPEPKREPLTWKEQGMEMLARARGKEARPKCFGTARTIKNFEHRRLPDIMVSVLFCY